MGLFDRGGRGPGSDPGGAVVPVHGKGFGPAAAATRLIERLLDVGVDGRGPFASAESVAAVALRAGDGDAAAAIRKIRRDHRRLAGAGGFVTGLGGFVTMPVSLPANVLGFYLIAARMTAAIAKVRGYAIDQPEIRSAVLLTLVGADREDLLKRAGLHATGGRITALATDRLPAPALMVLNKAVGFQLLAKAARGGFTKLGRWLPVLGGVIGGTVDLYLLWQIGKQADKEFPPLSPFVP